MDKYTRRADSTGWLKVLLTETKQKIFLCEYTRVRVTGEKDNRTYFNIVDGTIAVGKEASLTKPNAERFLNALGPSGAASLTVTYEDGITSETSAFKGPLRQQFAVLSFNGKTARVTLNSVWGAGYTPIGIGTHSILAPDYSHASISTDGYASATPGTVGNDVWFPIGLDGSTQNSGRYVHIGHLSEGCVTVYELAKWTELYEYLISRRVAGTKGTRVGTLTVRRPPRRNS